MEKDQREIEATQEKRLTTHKRKREEEHSSDLNETEEEEIIVLPFAKESERWKMYESMEKPQRPHFAQMIEVPRSMRERGALLCMQMYYDIFSEVHNDVPISKADLDSYRETLEGLELNGFDVKATLSRVDQLLLEEQNRPKKETSREKRNLHITLVRCSSQDSLSSF